MLKTADGRNVEIITEDKPGMAIFTVYGTLDGKPCHWTKDGKFRADRRPDPRDIEWE